MKKYEQPENFFKGLIIAFAISMLFWSALIIIIM
jgi:hypothetical protein